MISYAQNGEDVRLSRAFAGQESGFYVDVGAHHPSYFSVTKHFYDRGWSGVNVEPTPVLLEELVKHRPRDVNLNVGCSSENGRRVFYEAPEYNGLSTFSLEEVRAHEQRGVRFNQILVDTVTLDDVFSTHVGDRVVDFLSVDVEGHELEVLGGINFGRFRPRVVVVEAVRPLSSEPTHQRWEHLLVERGYQVCVFDGLNRFYVRLEDAHLVGILIGDGAR